MRYLMVLCFILVSCSNIMSKNMISEGTFKIRGGVFQNVEWKDGLPFKHVGWYKELTLMFDLMITRLDRSSPFHDWLSNSEKELLASCRDSYVVMTYSLDSERITNTMFLENAKRSGYEKVSLNKFLEHLRMHPDYDSHSLRLYDVFGLCRKTEGPDQKLSIRFPGFKEVVIR